MLRLLFLITSTLVAQPKKILTLPYYDWGACPFEGCTYREWRVNKPVSVYDTWKNSRHPIAHLAVGDKAQGVTGVVITVRPGVIKMDRDLPEQQLKRGETILTYAYRGGGASAAWVHGRYESEFNIGFAGPPHGGCQGNSCVATYIDPGVKHWWAQVKLKNGTRGWVNMDDLRFDGVDMLAMRTRVRQRLEESRLYRFPSLGTRSDDVEVSSPTHL